MNAQLDSREGQAGPDGVAERPGVVRKLGHASGAKGPQFKVNGRRGDSRESGVSLTPPRKVRKLQTTLHAKAKEAPSYRFYTLYDKVSRRDVLDYAYRCCRANGGAPGTDGQSFDDIETYGRERWLDELTEALRAGRYRVEAVRRVEIPKPNGQRRPLGIPTVRTRVVQTAVGVVLGPIFEADRPPEQYAYRSHSSALDAVRQVHRLLHTGYTHVVDADVSGYFDSLPHVELMRAVARRASDGRLLRLIKMWLQALVEEVDKKGRRCRTTRNKDDGRGCPQVAPISPLLANVYMRQFILGWKQLGHEHRFRAKLVNYADDLVICCRGQASEAMAAMRGMMQRLRLTVNEEKTQVRRIPEESVDFLGYSLGRCWSPKTGRAHIGTRPSKKALTRLYRAISEHTSRRWVCRDHKFQIDTLNRLLVGWANYFCLGPVSHAYECVDRHTRHRLRQWLCRKHKVWGQGTSRFPDQYLHTHLGLPSCECAPATFRGRPHESLSESPVRETCTPGSMSGMWKRRTVELLRHRQTKGPDTDRLHLINRATSRLYNW